MKNTSVDSQADKSVNTDGNEVRAAGQSRKRSHCSEFGTKRLGSDLLRASSISQRSRPARVHGRPGLNFILEGPCGSSPLLENRSHISGTALARNDLSSISPS